MSDMGKKLILISLILALAASAAVFAYLNSLKTPDNKIQETIVLVAAENIPPRTLIDKKMIKEIKVTYDAVFETYIKDSSAVIGKYSKETILKNEGFISDKLVDEKSDELSLKIESNNRAVSVNVTGDSGVSDLIKADDYVDISVFLAEKKDGDEVIRPDTAMIILQNIRVLAVDKQLYRDNNNKNEENAKIPSTFLVTLSIPSSDIEKLTLAESIGTLKLALRPAREDKIIDSNGATWEELRVTGDSASSEKTGAYAVDSSKNDSYTMYTIKQGDTLKKISEAFYGDPNKYQILKDANAIPDENMIIIGEVIKIPSQK